MCGSMMDGWPMASSGLWWAVAFALILGAGALAIAMTGLLRRPALARSAPAAELEDSALTTLKERYARGEIDDEEFHARLNTLMSRT